MGADNHPTVDMIDQIDDSINYVSDVPDDYTLVTDSQEITAIMDHIGSDEQVGILFVKTANGDYTDVLATWGCVPMHHKPVRRIV